MIGQQLICELYNMGYRKIAIADKFIEGYFCDETDTYKIILIVNNENRFKIVNVANYELLKQKIICRDEFLHKERTFHFLTIFTHLDRKDKVNLMKKNVMYFSRYGKDSFTSHEQCFAEEWNRIQAVRAEMNNRKKAANFYEKKVHVSYVTAILILFCLTMFIINPDIYTWGISGKSYVSKRYSTLFTYAFLHGGLLHLLNNSIALGIFGSKLEKKIGHLKYIILIIISDVSAGAATVYFKLLDNDYNTPTVGISGVVFAILGALIYYQKKNNQNCTGLIVYTAISLIVGLFNPNTDNVVHISGLIFGVICIVYFHLYDEIKKAKLQNKILQQKINRNRRCQMM